MAIGTQRTGESRISNPVPTSFQIPDYLNPGANTAPLRGGLIVKHVNMSRNTILGLLAATVLTNCATRTTIEFMTPIYVTQKPFDAQFKMCEPLELEYYHNRCKVIYQRKDYCVTYFHRQINKDGNSNIKILCGVQDGPPKVKIER